MEVAILLNRKQGGFYFAAGIFSWLSTKARNAKENSYLCRENFPMLGEFALRSGYMCNSCSALQELQADQTCWKILIYS